VDLAKLIKQWITGAEYVVRVVTGIQMTYTVFFY